MLGINPISTCICTNLKISQNCFFLISWDIASLKNLQIAKKACILVWFLILYNQKHISVNLAQQKARYSKRKCVPVVWLYSVYRWLLIISHVSSAISPLDQHPQIYIFWLILLLALDQLRACNYASFCQLPWSSRCVLAWKIKRNINSSH